MVLFGRQLSDGMLFFPDQTEMNYIFGLFVVTNSAILSCVPCASCQQLSAGRMFSCLKRMIKCTAAAPNLRDLVHKTASIVKERWPLSNTLI